MKLHIASGKITKTRMRIVALTLAVRGHFGPDADGAAEVFEMLTRECISDVDEIQDWLH
jgi:hypothetical protein